MAMATRFDRGLSVVAFLCDWVWSRRDNEIISWWGGGNFFFHPRFVTTRQNNFLVVGWVILLPMSPRDKIIISWWGGGNCLLLEICHDETTRSSRGGCSHQNLHFLITFHSACTIHHEKIILSRGDRSRRDKIIFSLRGGGHLILFQMAITWEP